MSSVPPVSASCAGRRRPVAHRQNLLGGAGDDPRLTGVTVKALSLCVDAASYAADASVTVTPLLPAIEPLTFSVPALTVVGPPYVLAC